jgi:hypothetical protein
MKYKFDLICPRCMKTSEHVSDKRMPSPAVNCGDCLMSDVEIVEFKVVKVTEICSICGGSHPIGCCAQDGHG